MKYPFPSYTPTKWTSPSQQSSIIVPCSNEKLKCDEKSELPSTTGWDAEAQVQDGHLSFTRYYFFRVKDGVQINPREIPPIEIFRAPGFPKKFSRLPEDTRYVYLGNGSLTHGNGDIDDNVWCYKAEYELRLSDDDDEDENTKPWDRKPTNVSLTHPEVQKPFRYGYDNQNRRFKTVMHDSYYGEIQVPTCPVVNSAGDVIEAMRTKTNVQLNFTYFLKPSRFNINDVLDCIHTINKSKLMVLGTEIPAGRGFMEQMEPHYNVDDNGNEYWELNTSILLDRVGDGFARHLLDVGNRALWPLGGWDVTQYGVITQSTPYTLARAPQAVYGWWSFADWTKGQFNPQYNTYQIGNAAMLMKAKWFYENKSKPITKQEFTFEKLDQVPLNRDGTVDKVAMNPNGSAHKQYRTLTFQEHPQRDWDALNMPKRGVKW